jgi:hypothetical protein
MQPTCDAIGGRLRVAIYDLGARVLGAHAHSSPGRGRVASPLAALLDRQTRDRDEMQMVCTV